jgi:hypothetical protein
MSGLAETSPNPPSARTRVTDVVNVIHATALSVRIATGRACCEFATAAGLVRVVLPQDRFLLAARTERDGNGNPFPPVRSDTRSEANLRILEADADAVPVVVHPRRVSIPFGEGTQRCQAAWEILRADASLTIAAAAKAAGISRSYFARYMQLHHAEAYEIAKAAGSASRKKSRGVREKLLAAWLTLRANERMQVQQAAAAHGVVPASLSNYLQANHSEEWAALKLARRRTRLAEKRAAREARRPGRPILKPGGKLL